MPLSPSNRLLLSALALAMSLAILPVQAAVDAKVQQAAEHLKGPALKLLEQLVNIDSGSGYEPGLTQVRTLVEAELKKLGASIETFPNTAPDKSQHLVATLKGTGKANILMYRNFKDSYTSRRAPDKNVTARLAWESQRQIANLSAFRCKPLIKN